jgi:polyisoprenoid-binding protein YceI
MRSVVLASLMLTGLAAAAPAQPSAPARPVDPSGWVVDVAHSELTFKIRHFMSRVRGSFGKWQANLVADPTNLGAGAVDVTIDASTITTSNERRDADLRSSNFFEVEKYPTITFRSTKVEASGSDLTITGDLTMKGVTKPVVLKGTFNGVMKGGRGEDRAGFEASAKINRLDWGVTWNRVVEGGGTMLGDEVEITIAIEAFRPPQAGTK